MTRRAAGWSLVALLSLLPSCSDDTGATEPDITTIEFDAPGYVATDAGIWVVDGEDGRLFRVDPTSDEVLDELDLDGEPYAVTADDDTVWVTHPEGDRITRVGV